MSSMFTSSSQTFAFSFPDPELDEGPDGEEEPPDVDGPAPAEFPSSCPEDAPPLPPLPSALPEDPPPAV